MDEKLFDTLTGEIYAAVFDDAAWDNLMQTLRAQFDASVVTAMAWDRLDAAPFFLRTANSDPDFDHSYQEHFHNCDLWRLSFRYNGAVLQQPLVVTDEALVPRQMYLESEMYNDFSRHLDVGRGLFAHTDISEKLFAGFSIHRAARQPEFNSDEIKRLTVLAPHLKRGLHIYREMTALRVNAALFQTTFNELAAAVFLLDAQGQVVELNAAAKRLLDAPNGHSALTLRQGRLRALHPNDDTALAGALQPQPGFAPPAELVIQGLTPAARLRLTITPLGGDGAPLLADMNHRYRLRYLLLATPLVAPLPEAGHLMERWGLTQAEAEVALLLAQGLKAAQISVMRGKSINTIKAQLSHIYDKAGVESHAALLAKLLGGAD